MKLFRSPIGPVEKLQMKLLAAQKKPGTGTVARLLLKAWGVSIPPRTYIDPPFLPHAGTIVVHEKTVFGKDVVLFHNVTIGRKDIWQPPHADFEGFIIDDGAILCAGAVVLNDRGTLTVGAGSIIGANSVLSESTGPNEIWAGNPAKFIRRSAG